MAERLTDRLVRNLRAPDRAYTLAWDSDIKGFGIRVTAAGAKSFVLNYRAAGRVRRFTIGAYPDWTVAAARSEAKQLKREIDRGGDPMAERHDERTAPTMSDLASRYMHEHAITKSEQGRLGDASMLNKLILPTLGRIKVTDVRHSDVAQLHRKISERAPYRANRMVALLSKMLTLAIKWDWRTDNPAKGVERNPEVKRTRFLSLDEIQRLSAALAGHPEQVSANAVRLLMFTGARKGEVLRARWDMFDLETGVWVKPSAHTKQRREHRVPLSAPARSLLSDMKKSAYGPFVFPGKTTNQPLTDIKKTWASVCRAAGVENARIHDLRHSFASILVSRGASLPLIGALLGHTQVATTARYAHLYDEPLREAVELVGSTIESATELPSRPERAAGSQ